MLSFEELKRDKDILECIKAADMSLSRLGFTEHNIAHVTHVMNDAIKILSFLRYDNHTVELTKFACFLHDIGNIFGRDMHNVTGGVLAFQLLQQRGVPIEDISLITNAIVSHDTPPGKPTTTIAAALILGDKCDVRRSRVRKESINEFDIHDRVNYSIFYSNLTIENNTITLTVNMDPEFSSKYEYYEIFLDRMHMCKEAANVLNCEFKLEIQDEE